MINAPRKIKFQQREKNPRGQPSPQTLRFSQGKGERLVMNSKGPWGLACCLLPAFLCVHIFIEKETSEEEAVSRARVSVNRYKVGLLRLSPSLALYHEFETRNVDLW